MEKSPIEFKHAGGSLSFSHDAELIEVFAQLKETLGPVRAFELVFHAYAESEQAQVFLVDTWRGLGAPLSLIGEHGLNKLFFKASTHAKRAIIYSLIKSGNSDIAFGLLQRLDDPIVKSRLISNAAIFEKGRALRFIEGEFQIRKHCGSSDDSENHFYSTLLSEWGSTDFILQGIGERISIPENIFSQNDIVINEMNRILFEGMTVFSSEKISQGEIIAYLKGKLDRGQLGPLNENLASIVDISYLIPNPTLRSRYAAIIVQLMREGIPLPIKTAAFALGVLISSGRIEQVAGLIDSTRFDPTEELGHETFFELRRACAFAPSDVQRSNWANRFASTFAQNSAMPARKFFIDCATDGFPDDLKQPAAENGVRDLIDCLKPTKQTMGELRTSFGGKRIAVMFSGQLRSFQAIAERIKNAIIDPLEADVYVSTWDSAGISGGMHGDLSRIIGPTIFDVLPPELKEIDTFFGTFPALKKELESLSGNSENLLKSLSFGSIASIVDEKKFEYLITSHFPSEILSNRTLANQLKMFFMLRLSGMQLDDHIAGGGDPYDVVIRIRPDLDIKKFVYSDIKIRDFCDNVIDVPHTHPVGVADTFAAGNHSSMRKYFGMFDHIWRAKGFNGVNHGRNLYGEAFVFDALSAQGVRFHNNTEMLWYAFSSQILSHEKSVELMLQDLPEIDALSSKLKYC